MAHQGTPDRPARLGKPFAAHALRRPDQRGAPAGVVLLLPRGKEVSGRPPSPVAGWASMRALGRRLARAGEPHGLAVHLVRYRRGGWNGPEAALAEEATRAVEEAVLLHGDVPVCLVGVGMGGRAALRAAGHPGVVSVVALAPWLPADPEHGAAGPEPEPVKQLASRQVLIVHGTDDARVAPDRSFRLAERIKKTNREVCRFEVHTDGHALRGYRWEVHTLTADFALGTLFGTPLPRAVRDALAAPPPLGLRMPLASGFGRVRER
ncbi:alpha/beta hydrolase [Streptomyces sp. NPDC005012]|uniref:alpha/beta hydrolase n=1 Tax=Streptomyces sp. NPDC005012 TaxID=3154558 RepID=UPI0033ADA3C1